MPQTAQRKKARWKLIHQYYTYTGFYQFLFISLKKSILPILLFIGAIAAVHIWVIDVKEILAYLNAEMSTIDVLVFSFISETFLGLIPPEIFIAWSRDTSSPLLFLSLLALSSYIGGIISYWGGRSLYRIPSVHNYLEIRMRKHILQMKKWGAILIAVGALLPLPFSISCIAAGLIKFSFKQLLIIGLLRFVRYYIYAIAIFKVVSQL
ncbi:hypothetical protein GCM10009117_02900 [Gangjinia marincola]|uniref:Short-chain dehydrogenase n=1 Tax=Gangjinia marincola TaxID=578463 RepID=A0ABN1ME92_9FLAO